ncbi:alkaline serine protease P32, partial [Ascobolus immersus RN42]
IITQKDAVWGLARISHLGTGPWSSHQYLDCDTTTYSYIVDTGIFLQHEEFEGRAEWGANTIDDDDTDGEGHGTHVAGTIMSKTYGIAKKGKAIAVKVLDQYGSGSFSSVMAGFTWAFNDAKEKGRLSVSSINASLGGAYSQSLNELVSKIHNQGLYVVVAAGNSGDDASYYSPASAADVTCVAAIDNADTRPEFSNYGKNIDIFAPGVQIRSTSNKQKATKILSGTSMAAPHIAGLAAYYQCAYGARTHKEINDRLQKCSAKGFVKDGRSSKDKENVATNCFPNSGGTIKTKGGALLEADYVPAI